jgi:hypothetical protein
MTTAGPLCLRYGSKGRYRPSGADRGTWQSNTYDTGVAWCATVSGPCRTSGTAPLLASTPTAVSPGGFDTFVDAHGKLWASYSAFPDRPANAEAAMAENRVLEIAPALSH